MRFLNVLRVPCSRIVLFNRVDARADAAPLQPLKLDGRCQGAPRLFAQSLMRRWPIVALHSPMGNEVEVVTFIAQSVQCESARNERTKAVSEGEAKQRTSLQATLIGHI